MDITPVLPKGRQIIETYGNGRFTIAGQKFLSSVIIFPNKTYPWPITSPSEITEESISVLVESASEFELLILGLGSSNIDSNENLKIILNDNKIRYDIMDTGAACRTFNVLLSEDRRVAAALLVID